MNICNWCAVVGTNKHIYIYIYMYSVAEISTCIMECNVLI
jgi:hypothetical protein